MANIKVKRSSVAGKIPLITDLAFGEIAVNTYDGLAFIKKSVDGVESVVALGGGGSSAGDLQKRYSYTATTGQTIFLAEYSPPYVDVYLNGVRLSTTDFTATNGTSVTLGTPAVAGDLVQVIGHKIFGIAEALALTGGTMTGAINFDSSQTWPIFNQNTSGSAATLATPRTIALTGDITYTSGGFDGSANVTGTATLANSGATAGTYGSDTNIPQIAVDAKGRITSVANVAVSIPSGSITFTGDVTGTGSTGASTALTLASAGTAGTYTKVTTDSKGRVTSGTTLAAADIPSLDASKITSGVIDAARLPSYVDDVVEAVNLAGFPATGETGKIYVALDTNKAYRWSGSAYIYITSGAVDSVAGKTGVVTLTSADVGLGSVENKSSATIRGEISSANVTTALGFTPYNSSNPNGYITSSALNPYLTSSTATSTYLPLTGGLLTGAVLTQTAASSWGVHSKTVGYSNESGIWFSANVGELLLRNAAGSLVTRIAADGSFAVINNSNILLANNFNSYAPTLTGVGASGTWGISVTGNAATATSASLIDGVEFRNGDSSSGINPDSISVNGTGYVGSISLFGQTDGALYSQAYSASWVHQIFGDYRTGQIAVRGRNSGSLTAWRTVLDSSNYTGFAMPIGASATNSVDVRAPIFYDSNDTGYYVDPNSGSRLANIFAGNVASTNDGGWNARMNLVGSSHARLDVVSNSDGIITTMYSHTGQGVGRVGTYSNHPLVLMAQGGAEGGTVYSGSLRSAMFYDSNDTFYYADPAGTSSFNVIRSYALAYQGSVSSDSTWGMYFDSSLSSAYGIYRGSGAWNHPYPDLRIAFHTGIQLGANPGYGGTRFYNDYDMVTEIFSVGNTDNNVRVGYTLYSPNLYDSNNTSYYVDPASTTNLNVLYVGGQQVTGGAAGMSSAKGYFFAGF